MITRPIVVLIHGIWSDPSCWLAFCAGDRGKDGLCDLSAIFNRGGLTLLSPIFTVERADYKATNFENFEKNAPIVLEQIRNFIKNFKEKKKVAAVQADIVAHSMGGDVTRQMILTSDFLRNQNYRYGEIHKLITVDTPFLGSPFAGALKGEGKLCRDGFGDNGNKVGGAVDDLTAGSAALEKLKKKVVPIEAHVVAGVANKRQTDELLVNIDLKMKLFCTQVHRQARQLFASPTDLIVPKDSQVATGLIYFPQQGNSPPNTVVPDIIHAMDLTLFTFGPDSLSHNLVLDSGKKKIVGVDTTNPQTMIDLLNKPVTDEKVYLSITP